MSKQSENTAIDQHKKYTAAELAGLPFRDQTLDLEIRAQDLLSRLNVDEKVALSSGGSFFKARVVKRLGIRKFTMTDGPLGVAAHSTTFGRYTAFPVPIALAASWDVDLAKELGVAMGKETRAAGRDMILGPGFNICRTPLNGRTFEYYSEDPYFNARLAPKVVAGIQSQKVSACIKHFAANNQETRRMRVDVRVSERALEEIYFPAFKSCVDEAGAMSVMSSYNRINGTYGSAHKKLLNDKLRAQWGFEGFVVSDWFAARPIGSAKECVDGGLSLEMPGPGFGMKPSKLKAALNSIDPSEAISEATLDRNLIGFLRAMVFVGMFDDISSQPKGSKDHAALARKIACEGMTLLKNDNKLLPLNADAIKTMAIVGDNANKKMCRYGYGGSSAVWPPYEITPKRALKVFAKDKFKIIKDIEKADVVLVVVGTNHWFGSDSEGMDKKHLHMKRKQEALVRDCLQKNPNTVVTLINGSAITMDSFVDDAHTLLEAWYPGMEGGNALMDVLFGKVNPSGKLPITFPKRLEDSPAHKSELTFPGSNPDKKSGVIPEVHYDEGIMVGYRHFDTQDVEPLFPFGHGLSYTEFALKDARLVPSLVQKTLSIRSLKEQPLNVGFTLENVGGFDGAEVVQLYVASINPKVIRPLKELKGFQKVLLAKGESKECIMELSVADFSYYSEAQSCWVCDEGEYEIYLGSSSRKFYLKLSLRLSLELEAVS